MYLLEDMELDADVLHISLLKNEVLSWYTSVIY